MSTLIPETQCQDLRESVLVKIAEIVELFADCPVTRDEIKLQVFALVKQALQEVTNGRCDKFNQLTLAEVSPLMQRIDELGDELVEQLAFRFQNYP